jgi:hypothetical protein
MTAQVLLEPNDQRRRAHIWNIGRGLYEWGTEEMVNRRVLAAVDALTLTFDQP